MFEPRFTALNMNEILKYLGFRGQELTEDIAKQLRRCTDEVLQAATPRLTYRQEDGAVLGVTFAGKDIPTMLAPCEEVVLFGATLGPGVERLMMRYEVTNAADAVIMDACASTAIENICNNFESDMRAEIEAGGRYLTDRFSPGYGGLADTDDHHGAAQIRDGDHGHRAHAAAASTARLRALSHVPQLPVPQGGTQMQRGCKDGGIINMNMKWEI